MERASKSVAHEDENRTPFTPTAVIASPHATLTQREPMESYLVVVLDVYSAYIQGKVPLTYCTLYCEILEEKQAQRRPVVYSKKTSCRADVTSRRMPEREA